MHRATHCLIRTACSQALLAASLMAVGLHGEVRAASVDQAQRALQSDSWREFISSLESFYIHAPDLSAAQRACVAAVALAADELDDAQITDACLAAAARALPVAGDYTPATKVAAQRMSSPAAPFGSIGIEIGRGGKAGPILVVAPLANSPAERDGVQPGDQIYEIDGRDITALPMEKAILGFRGTPGSFVRLRLARGPETQMMTLDVKREVIRVSYARSKLIEKDVLWVRISYFGISASQDLFRQLAHQQAVLQGRTPRALIVDLRNCMGGALGEIQQALSAFVAAETIVGWSRGRNDMTALRAEPASTPLADAGGEAWRQARLVVLVDENTASGAELFAQALRQHRTAISVGTKTAGIASIDQQVSLPNGARVRVPRGLMLAADKSTWENSGLTPDIEFQSTSRFEFGAADDAGLARALQFLAASSSTQ